MGYCTLDDLNARVPESVIVSITDDEGIGSINLTRVTKAIDDASAEVDGYAQAKYPVPLNPVPALIVKVASDIALYNLFSRRGFDPENSADQVVVDRYKAAVKILENLARGLVTLGQATPAPRSEATIQSPPRVFSRESLKGF